MKIAGSVEIAILAGGIRGLNERPAGCRDCNILLLGVSLLYADITIYG